MAPALSAYDWLRLQRHVALPMVLGGVVAPNRRFWPWLVRWQTPVATSRFLRSVRNKYGPRAWLRFPFKSTLLVLDRDGIDQVLESKKNFADPFVKRRPLSRFTPSGVIVSRDPAWRCRHKLNTEVLAFGQAQHPDADTFVALANEIVEQLLDARPEVLMWDDFRSLAACISQQVIFGRGEFRLDFAEHLARLVSLSNWGFRRYPEYRSFFRRIDDQLDRHAQTHNRPESLVCAAARWLAGNSGGHDAKASSQAAFWLFVMKDAIELHTVRTLALIASASDDVRQRLMEEVQAAGPKADAVVGLRFLEACIKEQMRLWTPVPILLRVAVKDFTLCDIPIRAGQQILMHTGFYHRDTEVFGAAADRFSPEERLTDDKADTLSVTNSDPPLYVFSRGQQACAGQFLAIFLLKAVLAALLRHANWALLLDQRIDVCQVPAAIDQFALRFWRRPHHV